MGTPGASGYDYFEADGASLADGKWHHAVFTMGSGGVLSLYRDGVPAALNAQPSQALGGGQTRFGFIGDGSQASEYNGQRSNIKYSGDIAMVRLHQGTLAPYQASCSPAPLIHLSPLIHHSTHWIWTATAFSQ